MSEHQTLNDFTRNARELAAEYRRQAKDSIRGATTLAKGEEFERDVYMKAADEFFLVAAALDHFAHSAGAVAAFISVPR